MSESIRSILEENLKKLEPAKRGELEQDSIELSVKNWLSNPGVHTLVPKKNGGQDEIDLDKPINPLHVEDVRKYIGNIIEKELRRL